MRINRPSLYAAFGNKEALFRKALDRYASGPAAYVYAAIDEPTARGVVEKLLRGAVDLVTGARRPRGCLLVQGALACGRESDTMRRELVSRRAAGEARLRKRFEQAAAEGDLPTGTDPADLARYVTTIVHGMAIQAAGGASREQLRRVAGMVLRSWPGERHA
jgi:AcrR family transcriptional regulator